MEFKYTAIILAFAGTYSTASAAIDIETAITRCTAPEVTEHYLQTTDFRWYYNRSQMADKFQEIYFSGKRLRHRARWVADSEQFQMVFKSKYTEQPVSISSGFIERIASHLEQAIELDYVEHVFFPDMGHTHMMVPQHYYRSEIRDLPVAKIHLAYEKMLNYPGTRFLYHTAEQFDLLDEDFNPHADRYLGWRFYTRNLVGHGKGEHLSIYKNLQSLGNAVYTAPDGFHWWSSGFNVSASVNGCFAYKKKGVTLFFDISLGNLPCPQEWTDSDSPELDIYARVNDSLTAGMWDSMLSQQINGCSVFAMR